ncbi:Na+/H+ antiporter subunit D [Truepera radiovictrix]|uniref:Multisubunit sodium/proton antiporter, MrpD subunit (2.A.63.1) n=1 Tax=Truepera radiovictrix (strain DSM 17093 / CIP 108686 / LMG 22925 / RQ-24) TaxID=649638 RepID=D7CUJ6_TRURR|nr:Na+/H+ antiporter subunit D [Truepera radiovictrix]ADI15781.1 multisubunit sodium/proton antiporter, MrpD subunit (2.A.63.1) [Truepera radiovictrix DSM 17093]WMT58592.1 Na+/H+ antiporter subunit D [Truepera radiovictrix]
MSWLLLSPLVVPLLSAALSLVLWRYDRAQRLLALLGSLTLLIVALALLSEVHTGGILVADVGNWPAPFGITFVADHLGAIMVVLSALVGLATTVYSLQDIGPERTDYGYYPLLQLLLFGVNGAFLTGDLFNLYVWFEVMLIASFVLMSLGGERAQLDGSLKYVFINLLSSALLLTAIGLTYGMTGTLNMADLALKLPQVENPGLVTAVATLFLIAFGLKAGVFPLFAWLPASYHTPPVAVSAIFAGLLTKVGVYTLIRAFTLLFTGDVGYTHTLLLWVSGLTMVTGVLGAAAQFEVRRILSWHIISQIGYMVMGLALYTPLALVGSVFYITHHIIVKANLFFVGGIIARLTGSFELKKIGGLYRASPLLSLLFLVPAFSLAGFPPLSGFWAKYILIRAGLEVGAFAIVGVALVVGILTLFSMTKIWNEAFWKKMPEGELEAPTGTRFGELWGLYLPVIFLASLTVLIGIYAQPFFVLADASAAELLSTERYVAAVLGTEAASALAGGSFEGGAP